MTISMIYIFFAAGLFLSMVSWVGFGLVKNQAFRVLLRTGSVSFFVTPSIIIGHGFAPASALLVMTLKDHFWIGLIPVLAVWLISFLIVILIPRARHARTKWPLDYVSILSEPAYIKLPIYGFILCLLWMGSIEFVSHYWYFGYLLLLSGVILNYFLSLHSSKRAHGGRLFRPLLFAIPAGIIGMFHFAVLWYIAGLAGLFVAHGKRERALWIGTATSIILLIGALMRTSSAIKYKNVAHITIQGGVTLAVATAVFFLSLTILFSVLAWKARDKQKQGMDDHRGRI